MSLQLSRKDKQKWGVVLASHFLYVIIELFEWRKYVAWEHCNDCIVVFLGAFLHELQFSLHCLRVGIAGVDWDGQFAFLSDGDVDFLVFYEFWLPEGLWVFFRLFHGLDKFCQAHA